MDYKGRQAALRARMERAGLDGCWLYERANVRYLCGFSGEDSTLLVSAERAVLVTDSRYSEQAEREARVDEVVSRHTTMAQAVAGLCRKLGIARLGFTAANLPHAGYLSLRQSAPRLHLHALKSGLAEGLRIRKDAEEVSAIRQAVRVAQDAFLALLGEVRPGVTEKWLAARLQYEMRSLGAEDASFDIICACGANASMPHAVTGDCKLAEGQGVLLDWGARLNGYCSDLTRVQGVGTIPASIEPLVDTVLEAQEAVLKALKPGERCSDADAAGRAVIARSGRGRFLGHSMGHGVGLAVHEEPRLGPGSDTVLLPGMVVTVEPGVYVPGKHGVRIEEVVLITNDGHEVLSDLPRRPQQLDARAQANLECTGSASYHPDPT